MITVIQNNAVSKWPKNVTCTHCKSELEIGELSDIRVNVESEDRVEITCPACGEQVILPDSSFTQAELKKARCLCGNNLEVECPRVSGEPSLYEGWTNLATCTLANQLDNLKYKDYVAWAKINQGGTVEQHCNTLGLITAGVNWDEIEEIYGSWN